MQWDNARRPEDRLAKPSHPEQEEENSDDKLEDLLNEKGYNIARRTVAKYREQLNIPVARLRKEL